MWDTAIKEVLGIEENAVHGVLVENTKTGKEQIVPCKGLFLAIGHTPNTSSLKGILNLDEAGYIIPKAGTSVHTNIPNIFAAGDCVDHVYRQAITAAGLGCQAAISAERWLSERQEVSSMVESSTSTN